MDKCVFYDKGFCKKKYECEKLHPSTDCNGCDDKRLCTKRHRISCRNGPSCIYYKSNSCEFLHGIYNEEVSDASLINEKIITIGKNILDLTMLEDQVKQRIEIISDLVVKFNSINEIVNDFEHMLDEAAQKIALVSEHLKINNIIIGQNKQINQSDSLSNGYRNNTENNELEIERMKCSINFTDISQYNIHTDEYTLKCSKYGKYFKNRINLKRILTKIPFNEGCNVL